MAPEKPIWTPSPQRIANANLTRFITFVNNKFGSNIDDFDKLYQWTIDSVADFWESLWEFSELVHSKTYDSVLQYKQMFDARWFDNSRLNFAENLLRFRDDKIAIAHWREDESPQHLTYNELYNKVAECAAGLRNLGVEKGDRVAAFMPNIPETIIAMLATTSIGALWSSCSPDFGLRGVYDRFEQIRPKVLFTADGYRYGGKVFDSLATAFGLTKEIQSIEHLVIVPVIDSNVKAGTNRSMLFSDLIEKTAKKIDFEQLPFDHPVYVMYSSGTTGVPKCIVHGAGGTLLQHYKEHLLHTDLKREDTLFYFTTCGWMMWNWMVSALSIGSTIFLYDGNPFYPDPNVLWRAVEKEGITVFGTSPKFLSSSETAGVTPSAEADLATLRTILSTGSPLSGENFDYVYLKIKQDVQLASISGGTDIISCFMLGNSVGAVYRGEIQCRGLGMKVEALDDNGEPLLNEVGELVCSAPFPSRPVRFWNDPDDKKYRAAYYEYFPGIWRHGDYIRITDHGGIVVHGRSDATLNPGGVRIGTAEIYEPVEAMDEISDCLVIGNRINNDIEILLFVVVTDNMPLDNELIAKIKKNIRTKTTPRHAPKEIYKVDDIPRTINGKKVELAVTRIFRKESVPNLDSLANPDSLKQYRQIAGNIKPDDSN